MEDKDGELGSVLQIVQEALEVKASLLCVPVPIGPDVLHSPFLLKVFRCIVIINQSFTIKLKWPIETNSSETVLPPLIKTGVAGVRDNIHLAF